MPSVFYIFSGERYGEMLWIASVEGSDNARVAMNHAADNKPGKYFIWDVNGNCEFASIDTTP